MRSYYKGVARDQYGAIIGGATIAIYLAGTTTVASVYTVLIGGTAVNSVTADIEGVFYFYVDTSDYSNIQLFKLVISYLGNTATYDNISAFYYDNYYIDALGEYGGGTAYTQATIEAALTAIGTTNKATLLLRPGTWVISSNADWSAYTNVTFKIVPGAVLQIATATTIAFGGPVDAGLYQIFACADTTALVVFGSGSVDEGYFEWWGAKTGSASYATANDIAMQAAIVSRIPIKLAKGNYYFDTSLAMAYTTCIRGIDRASSILTYTGIGSALVSTEAGVRSFRHRISNFWLTCNNAANAGWGINFQEVLTYGIIEDIEITGFGVGGIWLKKGWVNVVRKCMIRASCLKVDGAVFGIKIGGLPGQTTSTLLSNNYVSGAQNTAVTGVGIYWEDAYKCWDEYNITESCDIGRTVTWTGTGVTTSVTVVSPYYEATVTDLVWNDSFGTYFGETNPNDVATWATVHRNYRTVAFISPNGTESTRFGSTYIAGRLWAKGGLEYASVLLDNNNIVFEPSVYHIFRAAPATARTITMPTAVGIEGVVMTVTKTVGTGTTTIIPDGAETIAGKATYTLNAIGEHVTLISDGAIWQVIEAGGIKQAAIADTTGITLVSEVETELNKIKAALRAFGIIAP